jgi:hypothetical protein
MSVQKFRRAGIDGMAVERLLQHTSRISGDLELIGQALQSFSDEDLALLRYEVGLAANAVREPVSPRDDLLADAIKAEKVAVLAGEIMRRKPSLLRE